MVRDMDERVREVYTLLQLSNKDYIVWKFFIIGRILLSMDSYELLAR